MTAYTPSVDLTIFPRVNFYKTFGTRFDARASNGRIFGADFVSLGVLSNPTLDASNDYGVGNTVTGTTAIFQGGNPDNTTYRYRWQYRATSASTWVSESWTNYDNTAVDVTYAVTAGGQIRLNAQGRDATDPDAVVQINSFTQVKDTTTVLGVATIKPSDVGSCSVDDAITFQVSVAGGTTDSANHNYEWSVRNGSAEIISSFNFERTCEFKFSTAGLVTIQVYVGDQYATNSPITAVHDIVVN